jgi:glycosyltransferase involved in cell wall biosynthesis
VTPSLSIVIPCYNEEQGLPLCIATVDGYVRSKPADSVEVIVVDDGSTDGSWGVLEGLLAGRSGWYGVRLITNRGSHIALRCALRHATGERVVNLPVDLQDPVENVDLLRLAMDEQRVDAVLAVRRTRAQCIS